MLLVPGYTEVFYRQAKKPRVQAVYTIPYAGVGGRKKHAPMVFALASRRSHENFFAFTHIKYRQFFSDIKRENQNCRKIGSVARKIKKSILSNFFSIESTSEVSDLRLEKLSFS